MARTAVIVGLCLLGCGQTQRDGVAASGGQGGSQGDGGDSCVGAFWKTIPPPPNARTRYGHRAAAHGVDEVVVWGGLETKLVALGTGLRISVQGTWNPIPEIGAPTPRTSHALGVIDDELLLYGGAGGSDLASLADGASLNLSDETWKDLPIAGGPAARAGAYSGGAGGRWLVWGGADVDVFTDGAAYDLSTNTWSAIADAPVQFDAESSALAQTDIGPAIFGGSHGQDLTNLGYLRFVDGGWKAFPTEGAPSPRAGASMVWARSTNELIVWGGWVMSPAPTVVADGARLSLKDWTWRPLSTEGAPEARKQHYAVALESSGGAKMVVVGGQSLEWLSTGGVYDILKDTWAPLPVDECMPPARTAATFTAFGSGTQALLWGGLAGPEKGWVLTLSP